MLAEQSSSSDPQMTTNKTNNANRFLIVFSFDNRKSKSTPFSKLEVEKNQQINSFNSIHSGQKTARNLKFCQFNIYKLSSNLEVTLTNMTVIGKHFLSLGGLSDKKVYREDKPWLQQDHLQCQSLQLLASLAFLYPNHVPANNDTHVSQIIFNKQNSQTKVNLGNYKHTFRRPKLHLK